MAHSYTNLLYHLLFAIKDRRSLLTPPTAASESSVDLGAHVGRPRFPRVALRSTRGYTPRPGRSDVSTFGLFDVFPCAPSRAALAATNHLHGPQRNRSLVI